MYLSKKEIDARDERIKEELINEKEFWNTFDTRVNPAVIGYYYTSHVYHNDLKLSIISKDN
jgi:hypothetical protein